VTKPPAPLILDQKWLDLKAPGSPGEQLRSNEIKLECRKLSKLSKQILGKFSQSAMRAEHRVVIGCCLKVPFVWSLIKDQTLLSKMLSRIQRYSRGA